LPTALKESNENGTDARVITDAGLSPDYCAGLKRRRHYLAEESGRGLTENLENQHLRMMIDHFGIGAFWRR
jgi:hypothetical protein